MLGGLVLKIGACTVITKKCIRLEMFQNVFVNVGSVLEVIVLQILQIIINSPKNTRIHGKNSVHFS